MKTLLQSLVVAVIALSALSCASIGAQEEFWMGDSRNTERVVPDVWSGVCIYRGTGVDLGVWGMLTGLREPDPPDAQDGTWYMLLLDLPFSLAADTVLLPLTICQQCGLFGTPRR